MPTALVIDDSRAIRMVLTRTLAKFGYDVHSAGDGKEAIDWVHQGHRPDLVLVDWNMPIMNGLEFIQEFRHDKEQSQVPLLMVTTETEIEQMVRALDAGANEYVMKPFTDEVIEEKLKLLGVR